MLAGAVLAPFDGCDDEAAQVGERIEAQEQRVEAQEQRIEELEGRLAAVEEQINPFVHAQQQRDAEAKAEEEAKAERAETWGSVTGRYRCTGGMVTGLVIRNGYAQVQMGGLEQLQGNKSYPARVRGDSLYVTDPQRGTIGWRIRKGGKVLVPSSPIIATRCTRRN